MVAAGAFTARSSKLRKTCNHSIAIRTSSTTRSRTPIPAGSRRRSRPPPAKRPRHRRNCPLRSNLTKPLLGTTPAAKMAQNPRSRRTTTIRMEPIPRLPKPTNPTKTPHPARRTMFREKQRIKRNSNSLPKAPRPIIIRMENRPLKSR